MQQQAVGRRAHGRPFAQKKHRRDEQEDNAGFSGASNKKDELIDKVHFIFASSLELYHLRNLEIYYNLIHLLYGHI